MDVSNGVLCFSNVENCAMSQLQAVIPCRWCYFYFAFLVDSYWYWDFIFLFRRLGPFQGVCSGATQVVSCLSVCLTLSIPAILNLSAIKTVILSFLNAWSPLSVTVQDKLNSFAGWAAQAAWCLNLDSSGWHFLNHNFQLGSQPGLAT